MVSLRYLIHSRFDLMFSVEFLSRYMENPYLEYLTSAKLVLRYIKETLGDKRKATSCPN